MRMRIEEIGPMDGFCNRKDLIGKVGEWEQETESFHSERFDGWKSGYMRYDLTCLYFIQVRVAPLDTEAYIGHRDKSVTDSGGCFDEPIRHGHPDFYKILDELRDLHSRKNRDYCGNDPLSNLRMCERGGIPAWKGVIIRLTDKISRLLSFMQKESYEVKDESLEDTLRDAAIYSVLAIILYRESR